LLIRLICRRLEVVGLYNSKVGLYNSYFIVLRVIVNTKHFTICYECTKLTFLDFLNFFLFDYVIVLFFCVQQWVASIDGNLPF